jgi:hypothetical protein
MVGETSPLRDGEGELAFSNIKISLGVENGTGLGGEFVTQMGDFERCGEEGDHKGRPYLRWCESVNEWTDHEVGSYRGSFSTLKGSCYDVRGALLWYMRCYIMHENTLIK